MTKKVGLFIFGFALIALIGGIIMLTIQNSSPNIETFKVSEYQYYIKEFSSNENLGFIFDEKDLLKKVDVFLIEKYGERIKKEKPYQVFYDYESAIWLVKGMLPSNTIGGVVNILVEDGTGKILAVWHDK